MSIDEIAKARNFSTRTISNHLAELIERKQPVELHRLISPETQLEIQTAIEAIGTQWLKPIYEYFQGRYSYDEIRLVQATLKANTDRSLTMSS